VAAKVRVTDKGWNKIMSTAKKYAGLKGRVASVGIQGTTAGTRQGAPATNVMVGTVHEFGSPQRNIPERSFIRSTFDENVSKYEAELERISEMGAEGKEIEGELLLLAEKFRADILAKLASDIPPPTQRQQDPNNRKSGDPALFDTGQLWNSITAQVISAGDVQGM
jgi:hypothetical protein